MAPTSAVMNSSDSTQPLPPSPHSIPSLALPCQPGFAQQSPAQGSPKPHRAARMIPPPQIGWELKMLEMEGKQPLTAPWLTQMTQNTDLLFICFIYFISIIPV